MFEITGRRAVSAAATGLCGDGRVLLRPWAQKDSERYLPPLLQRAHGRAHGSDCVRKVLMTSLGSQMPTGPGWMEQASVESRATQPPRFSLAQGQPEGRRLRKSLGFTHAQPRLRLRPWICDQEQFLWLPPLPSISQAAWIRTRGQEGSGLGARKTGCCGVGCR